jgi:hypothetical protein
LTSCYQSLIFGDNPHSVLLFLQIIFVVFSYIKYIPNYLDNDSDLWLDYGMQKYANINNRKVTIWLV